MTWFNKTLDVNLEHTRLGYTLNQSINHQSFFRKEENTKASVFSTDLGRCCYAFCALIRAFSDPPSISSHFAFNDVEAEITLTSRRWSLVDFLFSLSRRWYVATFLPTFCSSSLYSKMIPKTACSTCYSHTMQKSYIGL